MILKLLTCTGFSVLVATVSLMCVEIGVDLYRSMHKAPPQYEIVSLQEGD